MHISWQGVKLATSRPGAGQTSVDASEAGRRLTLVRALNKQYGVQRKTLYPDYFMPYAQ